MSLLIGYCQSINTSLCYIAVKIPFINCSNKTLDQLSISCLKHNRKHILVLCNWQLLIHCSINKYSPLLFLSSSCSHQQTLDRPLSISCLLHLWIWVIGYCPFLGYLIISFFSSVPDNPNQKARKARQREVLLDAFLRALSGPYRDNIDSILLSLKEKLSRGWRDNVRLMY